MTDSGLRVAGTRLPQEEVTGDANPVNQEVAGLARGGFLNLLSSIVNQLVLLALTIFLARRLGRNAAGVYFEAYAIMQLLGLLSLSGFRAGLTRFVAVSLAERNRSAMRGMVRLGLGITTPTALLLGGGLALSAGWLSQHAFHEPVLATGLRLVAVALPASSLSNAALSATQGFRTMKPYALVGLVFEPLLRLILTVTLVSQGGNVKYALLALALSSWSGALAALAWLKLLMGRQRGEKVVYQVRRLFSFSLISWMASLASTGLLWADTIILGIYKSAAQVGVYTSSTRLVTLATFVMVPITASLAPRIANLYHRGLTEALARIYTASTSWIVRLSIPAFVVLLVFPHETLRFLFGPRFVTGASVTVILALGSMVDSATGPCGLMLNMSGRIILSMFDNVGALALNIALNLLLIPRYGIAGSAVAWAIALVIVNVARVVQVRRGLGMLPFEIGSFKGLLAGAVAAASGVAVQLALNGLPSLLAGVAAICVTYVVMIWLLGLSAEDRMVVTQLFNRSSALGQAVEPVFAATAQDGAAQDGAAQDAATGNMATGNSAAPAVEGIVQRQLTSTAAPGNLSPVPAVAGVADEPQVNPDRRSVDRTVATAVGFALVAFVLVRGFLRRRRV